MMSFKNFLHEMTMKAGDLSGSLQKTFDHYTDIIKDSDLTHVGDIGSVKVMRFEKSKSKSHQAPHVPMFIDFLVLDSSRIGIMIGDKRKINPKSSLWTNGIKTVLEIKEWFILSSYQRNGIGEKYLYFLKNVLKTPVLMGDVHSSQTQEFLKKKSLHQRFKISWYNTKTGELEQFDDSKYSLIEPSEWQVLLEADSRSVFEQFYTVPSIRTDYDWLFNV